MGTLSISGMFCQQPAGWGAPAPLCGFGCFASARTTLTSSFGLSTSISCSKGICRKLKKLLTAAQRRCTVTRTAAACWKLASEGLQSAFKPYAATTEAARRMFGDMCEASAIRHMSSVWSAGWHHVRPGPQAHVVTCMMCFSDKRRLSWIAAQDEQTPSQDKQWSLFMEPHLLILGELQTKIKNAQNSRKHNMHVEQAAVAAPTVSTRFVVINVWVRIEVFSPVRTHS